MGWIVMALIKLEALQGGAGSKRGDGTFVSPSTCCPWVQLISAHRGYASALFYANHTSVYALAWEPSSKAVVRLRYLLRLVEGLDTTSPPCREHGFVVCLRIHS